jgi:hypothetical protein
LKKVEILTNNQLLKFQQGNLGNVTLIKCAEFVCLLNCRIVWICNLKQCRFAMLAWNQTYLPTRPNPKQLLQSCICHWVSESSF